jgi:hypothetical protein
VHDVTVRAPEPFSLPNGLTPRTAEGITLGSPAEAVTSAYPTLAPAVDGQTGLLVARLGSSFMLIEVAQEASVVQAITVSKSEGTAAFCL